MKFTPDLDIRLGSTAILVALVLLGGCTDIRELLIQRKQDAFWDQYKQLDECQQVEVVQGYLSNGRGRDPILDIRWPTNSMMLSMLLPLGDRTGISRNIMISCWDGFSYGNDTLWLELIEPWQAVLGCHAPPADKLALLRWCDPLIAEA